MIQENTHAHIYWFWGGILFFFGFWMVGYDGITFSDDVFYLTTGQAFWEGYPLDQTHHFSSRIGAYLFSGLLTYSFGFSDHIGSLASLVAYGLILYIAFKLLAIRYFSWTVIFLTTQVYFLHFLPKVYPDSLLAWWIFLVPVASIYRFRYPLISAFTLVLALFMGFLTKETIVFLFPFPLILTFLDWRMGKLGKFHGGLLLIGCLFSVGYLGYYGILYGNPFFRVQAVHEGHYISEYTFFDKDWKAMLWRISGSPIVSFVERGYWLWIVLALPAVYTGLTTRKLTHQSFTIAFFCLIIGFWWMSTSLQYYNPLYLNPRHLLVLVPIVAVLIGLGANSWLNDGKIRSRMVLLIVFGALVAIIQQDWKQALFLGIFASVLWMRVVWSSNLQKISLMLLLIIPVMGSVWYQQRLKGYSHFTQQLSETLAQNEELIVVNNFVAFSKEVLFPGEVGKQQRMFAVENNQAFTQLAPDQFTFFIYRYYQHAYPKETPDIAYFFELVEQMGYEQSEIVSDPWIQVIKFKKTGASKVSDPGNS